ncbi:MAG TPA: ParB N-terminal domain-containing protein, partial [Bryobacteraceae bacterium]|nr:ParB N-terminal domain-containing protein [Bryobacteraceae bacterium]
MIINDQVALVNVAAVRQHPENPRAGNIEVIRQSIRKNGFYGFLIVQSSTGYIIAGNHRFLAAVAEGFSEVPVVYVNVDDQAALNILLADNHTSDLGGYDEMKLARLLLQVQADGSLEGATYSDLELKELVTRLEREVAAAAATSRGKTDDDEVPAPGPVPVSRLGDLWILGNHRLLCGDSTRPADVYRLMGGITERADMAFLDPPYGVDYDPEARENGPTSEERKANPLGKIKNDAMGAQEFRQFLDAAYTSIDSVLNPGRAIYMCHADTQGHHFRNAFIAQPWKLQCCIIWKKSSLVFGRADYHWIHEPILYGWKQGASHLWAG